MMTAGRTPRAALALLTALALVGCGDSFSGEEMHLANQAKLRPIALVTEPPEAAPGESVALTLLWHDPDPAGTVVSWSVALEYDLGLYETDPVERRIVDLETLAAIPAPTIDADGFHAQTFQVTVPDSVHLWSAGLATLLEDELLGELARAALGSSSDEVTVDDVDAFLSALDESDVDAMGATERELVLAMAELFAAEIRFRATLHGDVVVDVTRNLTVRHAGRLGSPNRNENPVIETWALAVVPREDADWDEIADIEDEIEWHPFPEPRGDEVPAVTVPRRAGVTYYLYVEATRERYGSPFSSATLEETLTHRWYSLWTGDPRSEFTFLRDDAGEDTGMGSLDESVRLEAPPGADAERFRVHAVVRDRRPEWDTLAYSPGVRVVVGDVVFE